MFESIMFKEGLFIFLGGMITAYIGMYFSACILRMKNTCAQAEPLQPGQQPLAHAPVATEDEAMVALAIAAASGMKPTAHVASSAPAPVAAPAPAPAAAPAPATPVAKGATHTVKAPLPGVILRLTATVGTPVKTGDAILILESMKMEIAIKAPADGTVQSINVAPGDKVNAEAILATLA